MMAKFCRCKSPFAVVLRNYNKILPTYLLVGSEGWICLLYEYVFPININKTQQLKIRLQTIEEWRIIYSRNNWKKSNWVW